MKECLLLEKMIPKQIVVPVDLNTAANTGLRFDMQKFKRVTFLVNLAAGTTTTTHTFSLKQHTVSSAGTPAVLAVANPYFHKIGAATEFTKVEVETEADSYDLHALLGNAVALVAFEVLAEDLTQGYRYVSLDIADTGGAQIGSCIALGHNGDLPAYDKAI